MESNNIKEAVFNNELLKNILDNLKDEEKKQTVEVIDNLLNEILAGGVNLIKAVEEVTKKERDK